MPTKTFPTAAAIAWLKELVLPETDLKQVEQRRKELEQAIARRSRC